jgi:hypothetical protein
MLSIVAFLAGVVGSGVTNEVPKTALSVLVKGKVNGKDTDSVTEKSESADADRDAEADNTEEGEGEHNKDAVGD